MQEVFQIQYGPLCYNKAIDISRDSDDITREILAFIEEADTKVGRWMDGLGQARSEYDDGPDYDIMPDHFNPAPKRTQMGWLNLGTLQSGPHIIWSMDFAKAQWNFGDPAADHYEQHRPDADAFCAEHPALMDYARFWVSEMAELGADYSYAQAIGRARSWLGIDFDEGMLLALARKLDKELSK